MRILYSIGHVRRANRANVIDAVADFALPCDDDVEVDVVVDCASEAVIPGAATAVWTADVGGVLVRNAHRRRFADRLEDYDVFAFADDTTLIRRSHLRAFTSVSGQLPLELAAGFLPIVEHPDGSRTCPDDVGPHHWRPGSAQRVGPEVVAEFIGPAARCYALTRDQLRLCLRSGHYLVAPNARSVHGDAAGGADPYAPCGLTRVVSITDLGSFLVPHTPMDGKVGAPLPHLEATADAAAQALDDPSQGSSLFAEPHAAANTAEPIDYHQPRFDSVVDALPGGASRVLSIGVGSGETERALVERGHHVTVIPLDDVVAGVLAGAGLEVVSPRWDDALAQLAGRRFDAVVAIDVISRFADPVAVLRELFELLATGGSIVATVPGRRGRRLHVGPGRDSSVVAPLDVQRWLVTAGFGRTSSSIACNGDGDPTRDRTRMVRGVKRVPPSPRREAGFVRSMVSVGVPVFNGMRYLPESLDALRRQTYPNIEIVISDNGSTDDTEEYCRTAAMEDSRIRYFRHETNRGAAFNYNHVFEMSRGEFFSWNAHDDLRDVRNIERCVAEFSHLPSSYVTVASRAVFIDETGSLIKFDNDDNSARMDDPPARLRQILRNVNRVNSIWGVTRARTLERTNLIGSFIGSDYVLLAELALLGRVHVLDEQLFARRLHAEASRVAHVSKRDVARWFDSSARTPVLTTRQRLALEYWRAAGRADLAPIDRIVARQSIPIVMTVRRARVRGGRAKQRIRAWRAAQ